MRPSQLSRSAMRDVGEAIKHWPTQLGSGRDEEAAWQQHAEAFLGDLPRRALLRGDLEQLLGRYMDAIEAEGHDWEDEPWAIRSEGDLLLFQNQFAALIEGARDRFVLR